MRRLLFSLSIFILLGAAVAEEPVNKFRITMGANVLTGTEEYSLTKSPEGHRLTSKINIVRGANTIAMSQDQTLAADYSPLKYTLDISVGGDLSKIVLTRDAQGYHERIETHGQTPTNDFPAQPNTIVVDNLVVSHLQILVDAFAAKTPAQLTMMVPQVLAAIPAQFVATGNDSGTLDGKPVQLRTYRLETKGTTEDIWADAKDNRLMRVVIPLQKIVIEREGFVVAKPAAPVADATFIEREVTFPSGNLTFPATLTLPVKATGKVPLAVFVHGSGANDRDETIGPNKPFADLAHGLAAQGIASLRYDKRTFAFPKQIKPGDLTIDTEVLDDAIAAIKYAQSLPETHPPDVFLLGHSLGATVGPIIGQRIKVRGEILMAPAARPLDEVILEQIPFRMKQEGVPESAINAQSDELKKQFARVRSGEAKDDDVVFHAPARYWRSLFKLDIGGAIKETSTPMLVLRGAKDYQVSNTDFESVVKAASGKTAASFGAHTFPGLNHLFIPVQGDSTGAEYGIAGHVDPKVIDAIAAWIKGQMSITERSPAAAH